MLGKSTGGSTGNLIRVVMNEAPINSLPGQFINREVKIDVYGRPVTANGYRSGSTKFYNFLKVSTSF